MHPHIGTGIGQRERALHAVQILQRDRVIESQY